MAGAVYCGDRRVNKPGDRIKPGQPLRLKGQDHPWVSRGGLKLDHGLQTFGLDVTGLLGLDLGASTGGFTDVLLARGAAHVVAVDVGHGQLAWTLRTDSRVTVLEKTNARHLTADHLPAAPGIVTCDASFISLKTVLPAALDLAAPGARLVALIKPQFEVGRGQVGKGGVVRDPALHQAVCHDIASWLGAIGPWRVQGVIESPVTGPEGNREFLIAAHKGETA